MRKAAATPKEIVQRKYPGAHCLRENRAEMYVIYESCWLPKKVLARASTPTQAWRLAEQKLRKAHS